MKNYQNRIIARLCLLALLATVVLQGLNLVYAQSSSNYKLNGYEIGGGGSVSDSTSFSLEGILGQSADIQSSTNFKANSGLLNVQMANVPAAPTFVNTSSWYNKLKMTINPTTGSLGSISHQSSTSGGAVTSGTTLTFAHTIGSGSNKLLVVSVGIESAASGAISSVTYNGVAMTQGATIATSESTVHTVHLYYMLQADLPSTGSYDVVVTLGTALSTGQMIGAATSVSGVAQGAPEATQTSQTGVDGTIHSTNITTLTNGAWVFDVIGGGNSTTWTEDGGQVERSDQIGGGFASAMATSTKLVSTAGSTTVGWTASGTQNRFAHALAAWAPEIVSGDPSDSTYAIAISTDAFASDVKYVQSDNTIGSALGPEDFQTYSTWGGSSGFFIIGLTPSTTYTVKVKSAQGDFTESGYGPTSSVATSALQISFDIDIGGASDPGETGSPYSINVGTLTPGSVITATDRIWVDLATNAESGGFVYVYDVNAGLKSSLHNFTIDSATANLASGGVTKGFGLQGGSKTQTSGGPLDYTSPYNGASDNVGVIDTSVREIFNSTNTSIVAGRGSVLLKAKSSSVTPASTDYADTLTLVATGSF